MFDGDKGSSGPSNRSERGGGSRASSVAVEAWVEGDDEGPRPPPTAMEFMDEESAANYRRILDKRRVSRQGAAERKSRGRPRGRLPTPSAGSQTSTDDLPDDPLNIVAASAARSGVAPPPRSSLSHARRRLQISESESNDDVDGEPDVLDRRVVIPQRLRTRPAVSAARSRIEEARRSMHWPAYHSSSDFVSTPELEDTSGDSAAGDSTRRAQIQVDMPDTDSETEGGGPHTVLTIHDSSDDDNDFISDTDDMPSRPDKKVKPAPQGAAMEKFLSMFEPQRQAQTKGRHHMRIGGAGGRGLATDDAPGRPQTTKDSGGHSQDLDDDLADFIIDDDDDDDGNTFANGSAEHAGAWSVDVDVDGEGSSDGANTDSGRRAGPTLVRDRLHKTMALMPEEFSQLDLPTSFRTYVQYLVHWITNGRNKPELSHEDARYFYLAYITVARVVDSIEQSLVASSAWVDGFRSDLHRFPEFAAQGILGIPGCEACHFRQNRTATFCVTLFGTPYSRQELAPPRSGVSSGTNEDSSEAGSDADGEDGDIVLEGGNGTADVPASYNVGRICKMRSEQCHELHHYFYHLACRVDVALQTVMPGGELDKPSGVADPEPDDLVSMLEEQGITDQLFSDFKSLLSRAKSGFTT
ncbi:hypothetical protein LPJ61_003453 [Coemansia biformis]|uniref:DUF4211 domain-containing protein n=1 Tax=Coemansia biformis TaxID=1286918 RepID=A0A9W7Y6J6_9FUNG|nr:hypothetical protein LPJ61_003453 [Coemansia biformis]